MKKMIFQSN